ncbi:MAG TPA: DUF6714 family protein [Thermoanaerobaculia bacterium]|nr:DUF6714 family protein [Thermoanaerobaculia bacterium]
MTGVVTAEAVEDEIVATFGARPVPAAPFLLRDDCATYEGNEARDWLGGKSWQDLRAEDVTLAQRDLVHFLSPDGWLYYLPALVRFALDPAHPAEMAETLLVKLAWYPHEVAARMTPAERRAIVRFLEYLDAEDEGRGLQGMPRLALDSHWAAEGGENDDALR